MITEMLGIPREREQFVLRVTNENFGIEDPEFQREGDPREEQLGFLAGGLGLPERDHRGAPREPARRPLDRARQGDDRRRAGAALRAVLALVPRHGRRARHDPKLDLERPPRVSRAPARAREAAAKPGADRDRGRRDRALDDAGEPLLAHRHRGLRAARADRSTRATRSRSSTRRPIETRRCSRTASSSASTATRIRTSASASASTSASARTSRASTCKIFWRQFAERFESIELAGAGRAAARELRRRAEAHPGSLQDSAGDDSAQT